MITFGKLKGKSYVAWSASMDLWFLGQGYHDHLKKTSKEVSEEKPNQWKKLDYQLCALLWQSFEPNTLANFTTFKTCNYFWKKTQSVFANDIKKLYDSAQKLASLKQSDHDMMTYISQAQFVVEELENLFGSRYIRRHKKET